MGICLPTVCLLNSGRVRIHLASHQPECLAKENRYFQEVKLYTVLCMCKQIHILHSSKDKEQLQTVQLLSLKIRNVSDHVGTFTPDTIEKLKQVRTK